MNNKFKLFLIGYTTYILLIFIIITLVSCGKIKVDTNPVDVNHKTEDVNHKINLPEIDQDTAELLCIYKNKSGNEGDLTDCLDAVALQFEII